MAATTDSDRIVVGVDFGTTFSGVAEAYSVNPPSADDIKVIKTWPGGNNTTSDKVPSEIAYDEVKKCEPESDEWTLVMSDTFDVEGLKTALGGESSTSNPDSAIRWGCELRADEPRFRCMKLFLDTDQDLPSFISRSEMHFQLKKSGKDVSAVVADYLRQIYKHTQAELLKRYGALFLETTGVQWILTVPAVWSDAAKDATLTAAKEAGMGREITLISEPEAAAVYTLQAVQPNHLRANDNFVVCDAGGGTVDLISYEIKQVRPLRIEESAEGTGACCGSVLLNVKFEELIRSKMGDAAFDHLCQTQSRSWLTALKYFEDYVKRNYDPAKPKDFNVPFPGVLDNDVAGIYQGYLTVTSREVGSIFRPIIVNIIKLVEKQISNLRKKGKEVAGIILVGGFGQSQCLYEALRLRFMGQRSGSLAKHNKDPKEPHLRFDVLHPANAWTAVVRGAVLRGLEGEELVTSRKSRRHYGVLHSSPFNAEIHPTSCSYYDELEDSWKADDRVTWYISKGQTVSSTEPVLFPFYRKFLPDSSMVITDELIVCNDDVAPNGFDEDTITSARTLCKLSVDLSEVPTHFFKTRKAPDGRQYQRLSYHLGVQVESGGLKFDMRIDDVVYGNVTARFDHE